MKLLASLGRELTLLSRSLYFYVELATTLIFLALLLLVLPQNFDTRTTEYYTFNLPPAAARAAEDAMLGRTEGAVREDVTLQVRGREVPARLYTTDMKYAYVVDSREDLIALAEDEGDIAVVIGDPQSGVRYEYYLQGYETERLQEYAALFAGADWQALAAAADAVPVRTLAADAPALNDRQQMLPMMLTVNCVLMGVLVMAAYVIEDKKTRTLQALFVAPVGVGNYLAAKAAAVLVTSLVACFAVAAPVMRAAANYGLLALCVVCGGGFMVALGAVVASYFSDMAAAFTTVYTLLLVLLVPAIADLFPGFSPLWLRILPSYFILEAMQDALANRNAGFVLAVAAGYLVLAAVAMAFAARRFGAARAGRA